MQTESRDASLLVIYAEVPLSYVKIMQTESRDASLLVIYAEVPLILCKDNANREQRCKLAYNLCRGAAYLMQR